MKAASTPYGLVRAVPGWRTFSLGNADLNEPEGVHLVRLLVTHGATTGAR